MKNSAMHTLRFTTGGRVMRQSGQTWRRLTLGLLVLAALALPGGLAHGASSAGPYYATPSWDQTLPAATRFIVLTNMSSQAVLDRETGLVWEQAPDGTNLYDWLSAQTHCNRLSQVGAPSVGGRLGWRLPTLQELASLVDPSQVNRPFLPAGHPFSNVQSSFYWSATTSASGASNAWFVFLFNGDVEIGTKAFTNFVWCVRGGHGVDPQ